MTNSDDTIAAISTPPGEGGVGMVRLSGPCALEIAASIFRASRGGDLRQNARRLMHGHVYAPDGRVIDEVLAVAMCAPHTYTREDVAEIMGHGGMGPLNAILEQALCRGARLAHPGEFTRRAFLNGRIDLIQAEAVIDQIRARTDAGLRAANAAAGGTLSKALHAMKADLAFALARIEAAVDFPEDDLPELVDDALLGRLREVHRSMTALLATADAGRICREGAVVAIAGRPNVGKSSLFNALLRDARAIVTAQAGTTRDRLEEYVSLGGIPVRLVDTAGLRASDDEVERIGVEVARSALRAAQMVLLVLDASCPLEEDDHGAAAEIAVLGTPVVLIMNKSDLAPDAPEPDLSLNFAKVCRVSALTGAGVQDLEQHLAAVLLHGAAFTADEPVLTRLHQKDSLRRAESCLARLLENPGLSPEFLALEIRQALHAIGEITGETTPDDILEAIFASFCIGK